MKFVLSDSPRYWWPVNAHVPDTDNPGEFIEQTFKVLFEPRDQDAEKVERDRILAIEDAGEQLKADRASLAAVVRDWADIVDQDKTPVPCTPETLDQLLRQPWGRVALWRAYHESQLGGEARLGN